MRKKNLASVALTVPGKSADPCKKYCAHVQVVNISINGVVVVIAGCVNQHCNATQYGGIVEYV